MSNFTKAQMPAEIMDPTQLKMFLQKLQTNIDVAFGDRDDEPFLTEAATSTEVTTSGIDTRRYELILS